MASEPEVPEVPEVDGVHDDPEFHDDPDDPDVVRRGGGGEDAGSGAGVVVPKADVEHPPPLIQA